MALSEGWRPLRGISGSGWDVQLCFNSRMAIGSRFATFYRRLEGDTFQELTLARYHATASEGELFHEKIRRAFELGTFALVMILDPTINDPNYGSF